MNNTLINHLVSQLEEILDQDIWLDENFHKKIGSLTEKEVFIRPIPKLHSVAELISHLLEWKKEAIQRLLGKGVNMSENSPENWLSNEVLQQKGWEKLKEDFYRVHHQLIQLIKYENDPYLDKEYAKGKSFKYLLDGIP